MQTSYIQTLATETKNTQANGSSDPANSKMKSMASLYLLGVHVKV